MDDSFNNYMRERQRLFEEFNQAHAEFKLKVKEFWEQCAEARRRIEMVKKSLEELEQKREDGAA